MGNIQPIYERFFEKVSKTKNCWLWTGSKDKKGYGRFRLGNKLWNAHRVSWLLHMGDIPKKLVLHNCPFGDNPSCVNPNHLFVGSHGDNAKDRESKRREYWAKRT